MSLLMNNNNLEPKKNKELFEKCCYCQEYGHQMSACPENNNQYCICNNNKPSDHSLVSCPAAKKNTKASKKIDSNIEIEKLIEQETQKITNNLNKQTMDMIDQLNILVAEETEKMMASLQKEKL